MKLTDFDKNYVFITKLELDNDYIVLREPTQAELSGFGEDNKRNLEQMEKIFPNCVIESSFTNENDEPATGKELVEHLKKSGSVFTSILTDWINSIPFQSRVKKAQK